MVVTIDFVFTNKFVNANLSAKIAIHTHDTIEFINLNSPTYVTDSISIYSIEDFYINQIRYNIIKDNHLYTVNELDSELNYATTSCGKYNIYKKYSIDELKEKLHYIDVDYKSNFSINYTLGDIDVIYSVNLLLPNIRSIYVKGRLIFEEKRVGTVSWYDNDGYLTYESVPNWSDYIVLELKQGTESFIELLKTPVQIYKGISHAKYENKINS
jgi:hypothetical protein